MANFLTNIAKAIPTVAKAVNTAKSSGTTNRGATSATYTPLETYNDAGLKDSMPNVYQQLRSNSEKWHTATPEEQARLSAENEAIRSKYGYSGGSDGSQFLQTQYTPLKEYNPNMVNYNNNLTKYYDDATVQNQQALELRKQQTINKINELRPEYEQTAEDASREAYINKMLTEKKLGETLSSAGLSTQGISQRQIADVNNAYGLNLSNITKDKIKALQGLDTKITDANYGYDISLAELGAEANLNKANLQKYADELLYSKYLDEYNRYLQEEEIKREQSNIDREFDYNKSIDDREFDYNKSIDDRNYALQTSKLGSKASRKSYSGGSSNNGTDDILFDEDTVNNAVSLDAKKEWMGKLLETKDLVSLSTLWQAVENAYTSGFLSQEDKLDLAKILVEQKGKLNTTSSSGRSNGGGGMTF